MIWLKKRNAKKFTIQFNMDMPKQVRAADYLNQLGRAKAYMIAELICSFLDTFDADKIGRTIDTEGLDRIDKTIQLNTSDLTLNEALSDNLSLWE